MIQNPKINFLDIATIVLKDTSPNSYFFLTENQSQNLDSRFGQNRAAYGSPEKRTITWVIEVQFG